jgi:GNAT superfamily N-acetyltransferase
VATLGVGATGIADLGILVEDAWQRRGVGTRLATSLLESARAKDVTTVHAEVLGDDQFILEALRRIGPLTVAIESGSLSVDIDLGDDHSWSKAPQPPDQEGRLNAPSTATQKELGANTPTFKKG